MNCKFLIYCCFYQEEIDIEYNKNVSKMIAGFIDNEVDDEGETVDATLDADSPNSREIKLFVIESSYKS